jgi:hypothetical protein
MIEPLGRRLTSWKEIAMYVHRDVRTLARWEKERGMPIRRVPGARGQIFAYSDEIDRWLTQTTVEADVPVSAPAPELPALPDPSTGVSLPPASRGVRYWPRFAIGAVALAIGLAAISLPAMSNPPLPVTSLVIQQNDLVALTAAGEAWRKPFGGRILLDAPDHGFAIADMTDDGQLEIAATIGRLNPMGHGDPTEPPSDSLHLFSQGGDLLWERHLKDSITFGSVRFDPPWSGGPLRMLPSRGSSRVLWLVHHQTWWPSMAVLLDAAGTTRGRFVHAGWLTSARALDDGTMLLGGVSNQYDSDVIMALDGRSWDGAGPEGEGIYECRDCPPGRPRKYVVLPRSELSRVTGATRRAAGIHVSEQGVAVHIVQATDGNANVIYEFSRDLTLTRVIPTDTYWTWHRALEAKRVVTHTAEVCPDRGPVTAKHWDRESGWTEVRVPSR